jgi:putative effector of murein hydrolase LrgA (UPF0299 family)
LKALNQLAIIFLILLAANYIASILPFPFSGSVLGMLLLLILLSTKIIKLEQVETGSGFLLDNMAFFFIPAGVGLINSLSTLQQHGVVFVAIMIFTTIMVMGVTAWVVDLFIKHQKRHD